ncbi:hypothetical protein NC652_025512 [Populus alba x Populus x berolinensis]|nr:hypothetical protein NC652_025512 [Populus alba x Populus x berolinensis]
MGEKFSLEILSIHYNEFDGEIPLEFCHLSQLRVLNLAQSRVPRGFAVLKLNDLPFNFRGGPVLLSIMRIKPRA